MRSILFVFVLYVAASLSAQTAPTGVLGQSRPIVITAGQVYFVARDPDGPCTGGPIAARNSVFGRFAPANGVPESVFDKGCHLAAIGYNFSEGVLYMVAKNAVARVKPSAAPAAYALLVDSSGQPFEAADLEFDGAGNAYLLKVDDRRRVYRVPKATFAAPQNGKIVVGAATATLPVNRPVALASNGSVVSLASLDTQKRLIVTKLTATGGFGPSSAFAAIPGALTDDLSVYEQGGFWYALKGGTLYRTKTMGGVASVAGSPDVAYATHDLTLFP